MRTPRKNSSAGVPFLRIYRAPKTGFIGVTIISPKLEEWITHRAGDGDEVCGRELGRPCRACDAGVATRRSIYALGHEWSGKHLGIVTFTGTAFDHCEPLQCVAGNCRGVQLKLSRLRPVPNAAVRIEVLEKRMESGLLPVVGDMLRRGLARLWQATPEDLAAMLAAVDEAELPGAQVAGDELPGAAELPAELPAPRPAAARPSGMIDWGSVRPIGSRPGCVLFTIDEHGRRSPAKPLGSAAEFPELLGAAAQAGDSPAAELAAAAAAELRRRLRGWSANGPAPGAAAEAS